MKRLLFVMATLMTVSSAFAQTPTPPIDCTKPFKFEGNSYRAFVAIQMLAGRCGYAIDNDGFEPINDFVPAAQYANLSAAVADIAKKSNFDVDVNHETKTISLYPPATAPSDVQVIEDSSTAGATTARQRAAVEDLLERYPQAHNSDGTIGSAKQSMLLRREIDARYRPQRTVDIEVGYSRPTNYRFSGGWRNYDLYGHMMVQNIMDLDTWGALRFKKGRESVMENIEVWGCGKRLASADEGNNIWDDRVFVPVNCSPLTFRYADGQGRDWEVEIAEQIVPLRILDSKKITLDARFFDRARVLTQRQRYLMTEQPDGSMIRTTR
jgi:hypothetical protein